MHYVFYLHFDLINQHIELHKVVKLLSFFFFFSPRKTLLHPFHLENTFNLTYDHVAAFLQEVLLALCLLLINGIKQHCLFNGLQGT